MQLSPEQAAKVARLWVWRPGHRAVGPTHHGKRYDHLILGVAEGNRPFTDRDYPANLGEAWPILEDDTTADGLPRTVRAAWGDPTLTAFCGMGGTNWILNTSAVEGTFATETEAWIAALLAAPENQNG